MALFGRVEAVFVITKTCSTLISTGNTNRPMTQRRRVKIQGSQRYVKMCIVNDNMYEREDGRDKSKCSSSAFAHWYIIKCRKCSWAWCLIFQWSTYVRLMKLPSDEVAYLHQMEAACRPLPSVKYLHQQTASISVIRFLLINYNI